MSLAKAKPAYTVDQYLALERSADARHLFLDGEIYAMAGESDAHGCISVNIVASLHAQLRGTSCQVRTRDTKVRSGPILSAGETARGLFCYPEVLVICGDPEFHDALKDVVLNPRAILEVLSESTEAFDRGEKFTRLQTWNPSLTDYVLVSQDRAQVEHFARQPDGSWSYRLTTGLDASIAIPSINCTLKLADVYERVALAEQV
jgi:Uma2 family endonuclease